MKADRKSGHGIEINLGFILILLVIPIIHLVQTVIMLFFFCFFFLQIPLILSCIKKIGHRALKMADWNV